MFIAERLEVTLPVVPVACLLLTCLAVLGTFFVLACNSPTPTDPIPPPLHQRTLTPTAINTPTPELIPPVTLEEPEDGSSFGCGSEVVLRWYCPRELQAGEFSRLRVRSKGQDSFTYHEANHYRLIDPPPGEYNWAVAMVRATEQGEYALLNEESGWRSFEIVPPPVVHRISPTCTIKGASVPVTVTGEHFARSLALTINVPLHAAFVNSSTVTTTIPMTLEVGEYLVIVKDSLGQGDSHASFTVSEPPPTPVPVTPRPVYPKPVLGGLDIYGHDVTFHWSWSGILTANDYFALRVGIGTPGESKLWTKETQASWSFTEQGDYVWEVAICRGDPAEADCSGNKQLVVSEWGTFSFAPPPPPRDTPKPP
jgi:hypothetical protein